MTRSSPESSPSRISERSPVASTSRGNDLFQPAIRNFLQCFPGGHKPVSKRISKSYLDEFHEESDNTLIHELLGEDETDKEEVSNLYD